MKKITYIIYLMTDSYGNTASAVVEEDNIKIDLSYKLTGKNGSKLNFYGEAYYLKSFCADHGITLRELHREEDFETLMTVPLSKSILSITTAEPKMKLREWVNNNRLSFIDKQIEKYLNENIIKEVSSVGMTTEDYCVEIRDNAPFKARYVYSFVILENGYAVGLNENPGRGLSTPVVKYKGKLS